VVVLRPEVDWGPASKLIPVLLEETDPATVIITVSCGCSALGLMMSIIMIMIVLRRRRMIKR
jgi:hypothetical protein